MAIPAPRDAAESTKSLVSKLGKGGRSKIEIGIRAPDATIDHSDGDRFALEIGSKLAIANGVQVGIGSSAWPRIKKQMRNRADVICGSAGDATGSQSRSVESALASVSTGK